MRALVTGGAGFIGSHLVDRLVGDGAEVRVIDDLSSGAEANVNPAADLVVADIADEAGSAAAIRGVDVVFHQAAHRAVLRSVEHPLQTDTANVHGTLVLLTAARDAGVRRFVSASSSSIYGDVGVFPTPEDTEKLPRSPYAVSKLAGEHYCRVYALLYGMETVSLRYFNAYGPRQRPDSAYALVIPLFLHALLSGERPEVHGDGTQSRDFTYIDDVIDANLLAATRPADRFAGKAYNIAGGRSYSLLELLDLLRELTGIVAEPVHVRLREGDVRRTEADISAAASDLGYQPKVGFREGLRRTIDAFGSVPESR